MENFLGATISLISKSDIRYIGVLHSINQQESTVALENVRSLGTEGRKANPADEINASPQVFEFIVFRGSDIKDLQVVEAPLPPPPQQPQFSDPAIVSQSKPQPLTPQTAPAQVAPQQQQQRSVEKPIPAIPAVAKPVESVKPFSKQPPSDDVVNKMENLRVTEQRADRRHDQGSSSRARISAPVDYAQMQNQGHRGGRGGAVTNNNRDGQANRVGGNQHQPKPAFAVPSSDFDFESANAKFNKSEVHTIRPEFEVDEADEVSRPALPTTVAPDDTFYDKKSSFFDNISCEARDRAEGER
ncbi:hypothetical protein HDU98_006606 [Podochytrium sp. JEL0797]|nr:hypothetical protein HDU98_006606 [Podochytrium sp. JEL0797]